MILINLSLPSQRGSEDVMIYLSKEAHKGKVRSILFLMPCHSTPYYSILHHDLPMRFLDCTPRCLQIKRFFHAHFKVDRDLQASVVVYALT
ncbi:hypothetical protein BHE74_00013070 [Ensete ventricosum]|uniref:Uncharacterized protein n=1 Tax=Ensete ventricosum TaxID=4639 RepID=A0A427B6A2_ENSVE|nr:hypothetical protein B296_00004151 [Ensete ventricosum]RWW29026.1 hypothetical protein GW17_00006462 [Ensete ventricosum]RWW78699.1 hypothetical protein BHE74_00013070 [Ensete ventricosum]